MVLDRKEFRPPVEYEGRTFDRQIHFDPRSARYGVMEMIEEATPRSYTWGFDVILDQGTEGACVGFAVAAELAAKPKEVGGVTNAFARMLYREAQKLDEWPGESYEGSSVLGGVKAAQARGHLSEYRWAFGIDDLAVAVSRMGPAILGINWYQGMYQTFSNRGQPWVAVEGRIVGGHAILAVGYSTTMKAFRLQNSWGSNWGHYGRAWIDHDALGFLLEAEGEACIPIKR